MRKATYTKLRPCSLQDAMSFELWATDKDNARYVTEPGMRLLVSKSLPLDSARVLEPKKYPICVTMHFGRGEVTLHAKDETSGRELHMVAGLDPQEAV